MTALNMSAPGAALITVGFWLVMLGIAWAWPR